MGLHLACLEFTAGFFISKTEKCLDALAFSFSLVIMQSLYEKVWKGVGCRRAHGALR